MGDREETETGRACPAWCRTTHAAGLHPEDQHHRSDVRHVALIAGNPLLEPDDLAVGCIAIARLVRRTDAEQTWVELVSDEGDEIRLVVTLESALRLRGALGELLATALP